MIPMRIDYVVGTAIAIAWEHLSLEESQENSTTSLVHGTIPRC